jgi:hypothetical protein
VVLPHGRCSASITPKEETGKSRFFVEAQFLQFPFTREKSEQRHLSRFHARIYRAALQQLCLEGDGARLSRGLDSSLQPHAVLPLVLSFALVVASG